MYGRGAAALAIGQLDCTIPEAQHYIDTWKARYPLYVKWAERTKYEAQHYGEVVALTGRKRRFYLIQSGDYELLNEAINMPIQNLATDLCLLALIDLHQALRPYDSYILISVHDAILFEVNKLHRDKVIELIKHYMSMPERYPGVPGIPVELKEGDNWGAMKTTS